MNRATVFGALGTVLSLVANPSWAADPPNTQSGNTTASGTILERTPISEHEHAGAGLWGLSAEEW